MATAKALMRADEMSDWVDSHNRIVDRDKGNFGDFVIWRYDGANYQLDSDNPSGNHANFGTGVVTIQDAGVTVNVDLTLQAAHKLIFNNAANTNSANLYHSDTNDLLKTDDSLLVSAGLMVGVSITSVAVGEVLVGADNTHRTTLGGASAGGWVGTKDNLAFVLMTNNADRVSIDTSGAVFVGDTTNINMTLGLTLNQAGNDNEILALKSSDVAHGMVSLAETDTYLDVSKVSGAGGGAFIVGYSSSQVAMWLQGNHTTDDTAKTSAAIGHIILQGWTKSGTSSTTPGANTNIIAVKAGSSTRFILDADGDSHQDVGTAWTNFDDEDDASLLTAVSVEVSRSDDPIRERFADILEANREALERARIVSGPRFVNMSRLTMLLTGAVRQLGERIETLETRLLALEGPHG